MHHSLNVTQKQLNMIVIMFRIALGDSLMKKIYLHIFFLLHLLCYHNVQHMRMVLPEACEQIEVADKQTGAERAKYVVLWEKIKI